MHCKPWIKRIGIALLIAGAARYYLGLGERLLDAYVTARRDSGPVYSAVAAPERLQFSELERMLEEATYVP